MISVSLGTVVLSDESTGARIECLRHACLALLVPLEYSDAAFCRDDSEDMELRSPGIGLGQMKPCGCRQANRFSGASQCSRLGRRSLPASATDPALRRGDAIGRRATGRRFWSVQSWKARWTLLKVAGGVAARHVAAGAPLPGELASSGGVSARRTRGSDCKHQG